MRADGDFTSRKPANIEALPSNLGNSGLKILSAPLSDPLRVNQDDQTSEWQGKVEMAPKLLAELKNKARQQGLSLFAYLAHFASQSNDDTPPPRSRFE